MRCTLDELVGAGTDRRSALDLGPLPLPVPVRVSRAPARSVLPAAEPEDADRRYERARLLAAGAWSATGALALAGALALGL